MLKSKEYHTSSGVLVHGVLIFLTYALSQPVDKPLKYVTHGQCDARPTVTFPVAGHRWPATGTKFQRSQQKRLNRSTCLTRYRLEWAQGIVSDGVQILMGRGSFEGENGPL